MNKRENLVNNINVKYMNKYFSQSFVNLFGPINVQFYGYSVKKKKSTVCKIMLKRFYVNGYF